MNRLAISADQAGETYPLLLNGMVEWLLAIITLLVVAGVGTIAVVLLNRHRAAKHEHDLHRDLHEQRQDIERREHRLSEREGRLDAESRHLEARAQEIAAAEAEVEAKRAELLDIEEERRRTLERVAGLLGAPDPVDAEQPLTVEHHLDEPDLSTRQIASANGISERHLHRMFDALESTPAAWIRLQRLERCRRELRDAQQLSITDIAYRWGFRDSGTFSKIFRRKTERYIRLATGGTGKLREGELPGELREVLADADGLTMIDVGEVLSHVDSPAAQTAIFEKALASDGFEQIEMLAIAADSVSTWPSITRVGTRPCGLIAR